MGARAAKVAFALSLAGLALAVVAIRLLAGGEAPAPTEPDRERRRAEAAGPERARQGEAGGRGEGAPGRRRRAERALSATEDRHEAEPEIASGMRRAARALGERFLSAYARYEVGDLDGARRGLRATATADFFAQLNRAPPRLPPTVRRVRRARLRTLEVLPGPVPESLQIAGLRVRAGRPEAFSFALVEEGGRLRVGGPAP